VADDDGEALLVDGDELAHTLQRLAAETRADDDTEARRRAAWLARQAEAEGTFAGILFDLAERRQPVVVQTTTARTHRGTLLAIGEDFLALRTQQGSDVLVRFDGVASVRTPGDMPAAGDRTLVVDADFRDAVYAVVDLRPRLLIVSTGTSEPLGGELRIAGRDSVTVRLDGGWTAYLPMGTIIEICSSERLID
jgi:hypothetical protein